MNVRRPLIAVILCLSFTHLNRAQEYNQQWPAWRGPLATGVAPQGDPPTTWSETENIRWKVEIPGEGSSTPIIWGNKIFLLTAVKTEKISETVPAEADQPKRSFGIVFPRNFYQFTVLCLDRATGKTLWSQVATERVPHAWAFPGRTGDARDDTRRPGCSLRLRVCGARTTRGRSACLVGGSIAKDRKTHQIILIDQTSHCEIV